MMTLMLLSLLSTSYCCLSLFYRPYLLIYLLLLCQCINSGNHHLDNNATMVKNPRWAIVALTRPTDMNINTRNANLKNYLRKYHHNHNISLLFFSEYRVKKYLDQWRKVFRSMATIKIITINTYNDGFNTNDRYGYKYVCRFFSISIFKYLKDDYDYYLRLDGDVFIKKLEYDIFSWTQMNDADYVFGIRKIEAHGPTRQTLPGFVKNYTAYYNITASNDMNESLSLCFNFYNNFHIGRVSFFTSEKVSHFLNAVDDTNSIVTHRWGDSSIHAYAVRLFSLPERVFEVVNFTYLHGSHGLVMISNGHGMESEVPNKLAPWLFVRKMEPEQETINTTSDSDKNTVKQFDLPQDSNSNTFFLLTFVGFFVFFLYCLRSD